ncbi:MAG: Na+/H+ antiporter NhaA [Planctomycetes bacterium]|nr:Na+/H+ antiporter NhaA [Planctomycetota bacterium]
MAHGATREPQRTLADVLLGPFVRFAHLEVAGGVVLLAVAVLALAWANSPLSPHYFALLDTKLTVGIGGGVLSKTLLHWINDGLMVAFFLVVGLEIKREILVGELASLRRAALPLAAALGGMLVPALLYVLVNPSGPATRGWGIPMATDIAFSLGVLSLAGRGVPLAVKVFLTALAIVDDLGAILVIALFYTERIETGALGFAAVFFVGLIGLNLAGFRRPGLYLLLGLGVWLGFLSSGIHSTLAGVLVAMTIPARASPDPEAFLRAQREDLERLTRDRDRLEDPELRPALTATLQRLEAQAAGMLAPLQRLEHALHPYVVFLILPLFAAANSGVDLRREEGVAFLDPVMLGIVLGLVVGKPLGICALSWLAVRAGLARLPTGTTWRHLLGVACLAGIGFTMSLFIASLAFGEGTLESNRAKEGVFVASLLSALAGLVILRGGSQPRAAEA